MQNRLSPDWRTLARKFWSSSTFYATGLRPAHNCRALLRSAGRAVDKFRYICQPSLSVLLDQPLPISHAGQHPAPSVRVMNHDPNPIDEHIIYKGTLKPDLAAKADLDGFIPLEDFTTYASSKVAAGQGSLRLNLDKIQDTAIVDWKKACGINNDCSMNVPRKANYMALQNSSVSLNISSNFSFVLYLIFPLLFYLYV
ncbi:hypothetical protein TELCIR_03480 [Teladorsagia circumcincta]|uniref:Uncharacterized protein n=1 Tax=Teladorsagia circumcincta TaxID=45464 RepID=A0A2G9UW71_TELCI|nr:hypothetical protein TELCIR_03480 [Teladorsagia circumcincta]